MKTSLADILFSRVCDACGRDMGEDAGVFCWDCRTQVRWVEPPYCACCGDPVFGHVPGEFICTWCAKTKPAFVWARSAARYDGIVQESLRRFKYHEGFWLRDGLVDWLVNALHAAAPGGAPPEVDAVSPVPLHIRRRRERGFNQSALLAEGLARRLGVPMRSHLWRIRATSTQTKLSAHQRAENVRGAFLPLWKWRIRGKRILLVDDVMTTGATLNECARTLKAAGAAAVYAVTVARG